MTLNDLWYRFQGHGTFEVEYLKNGTQRLLVLNISETTRDRAIVTVEREWEVICSVSNGDIFNGLDGPFPLAFQGKIIFEVQYLKTVCVTEWLWYSIY